MTLERHNQAAGRDHNLIRDHCIGRGDNKTLTLAELKDCAYLIFEPVPNQHTTRNNNIKPGMRYLLS